MIDQKVQQCPHLNQFLDLKDQRRNKRLENSLLKNYALQISRLKIVSRRKHFAFGGTAPQKKYNNYKLKAVLQGYAKKSACASSTKGPDTVYKLTGFSRRALWQIEN